MLSQSASGGTEFLGIIYKSVLVVAGWPLVLPDLNQENILAPVTAEDPLSGYRFFRSSCFLGSLQLGFRSFNRLLYHLHGLSSRCQYIQILFIFIMILRRSRRATCSGLVMVLSLFLASVPHGYPWPAWLYQIHWSPAWPVPSYWP